MMTSEGERQRALALALEAEAALARRRAASHDRGDEGELVVRELLGPLEADGWLILHRRRWPGTRRADLDHVLVGPGGVVVLDTKNWTGRVCLVHGRLLLGQSDETGELDDVRRQVEAVEELLVEHGVAPLQITGALVFVDQDIAPSVWGRVHVLDATHLLRWVRSLGRRLQPAVVRSVAEAIDHAVPAYEIDQKPPVPVVRPRPRPRSTEPAALFDVEELDLQELERASRLSLEQWMVYLHPAQLDVVRRRYNGPCRVRGPAGCGKTVVALHRAAYLAAQEPGDILFATYVRTLPLVLATLYRRLAPLTAHRVQFAGVHQLAMAVLSEAGVAARLDGAAADTSFNRAWARCGRLSLGDTGLPHSYWREEVQSVIKGRGLQDYEQYAELPRTGRRTALTAEQRRRVWDLYVCYQELLEQRHVRDFSDVIALALEVVRRGEARTYRFVVVDEAQDLDLLSVQLMAALASDGRDGLTLVGDGQQAVYPGGYTLREAGVAVTGRSSVLKVNYRNTRQVLDAAHEVVRGDAFDDLEDLGEVADVVDVLRNGSAVLQVQAADEASALVALLRQLQEDAAHGLPLGEAAVLCRHRREVDAVSRMLRAHGVDALDLVDYDGSPSGAVKVGTTKRAKGLEFDRVYLPRVDAYVTQDGAAEPERVERERRELFVAMTRARNGLWCCKVTAAAP